MFCKETYESKCKKIYSYIINLNPKFRKLDFIFLICYINIFFIFLLTCICCISVSQENKKMNNFHSIPCEACHLAQ